MKTKKIIIICFLLQLYLSLNAQNYSNFMIKEHCDESSAQTDTVQPAINKMARNTVYADFYGNGFQYSLSYDRILGSKNKWLSSITVGGTYLPYRVENYTAYKIIKERGQSNLGRYPKFGLVLNPSTIVFANINLLYNINRSKIAQKKKHYMELGTGPIITVNRKDRPQDYGYPYYYERSKVKNRYGSGLFLHINLNYRYQRHNGGFFFKTGISFINKLVEYKNEWFYNTFETSITPNISIGYSFKLKKNEK